MKNPQGIRVGMLILVWVAACSLFLGLGKAFAEIEINMDEDKPVAAPAKPVAPVQQAAPAESKPAQPASSAVESKVESEDSEEVEVESEEQAEPEEAEEEAPVATKMQSLYDAGISAYKLKQYDRAIKFLGKAIETKDPSTKKFYYAEAHAMLGVIFQFHKKKYGRAYRHYKTALTLDPQTKTAKKHIKEVYRFRFRKD